MEERLAFEFAYNIQLKAALGAGLLQRFLSSASGADHDTTSTVVIDGTGDAPLPANQMLPFVQRNENTTERVCFLLKVKPDRLEEYKRRHREVWPEMLQALRETGWKNYSLFLREDGLVVGYLETSDFQKALEGMGTREVNRRWQQDMAPFFEGLDGQYADQRLLRLEEVFHLN